MCAWQTEPRARETRDVYGLYKQTPGNITTLRLSICCGEEEEEEEEEEVSCNWALMRHNTKEEEERTPGVSVTFLY
ncbi:hypothetical protein EYF80_055836 [Liparis tanakae]|uniref:Uncharacterized protein n=1 Tax=Liparis tanakae TaxID=230148 RepID=A0A4Z2F037_9TELE|nr:hypothetical protein EYF80_055836 [Liparis tanakae]